MIENSLQNTYKYSVWSYNKKIPSEICDLIVNDFKNKDFDYGSIGKNNNVDFATRFVKSYNIPLDHWCHGFLLYYGIDSNIANFNYNLTNLSATYFLSYEKGMFYKPHKDMSDYINDPTHGRKLTVILQLTDPSEYEGGDLIWYDSDLNPNLMSKEKGSIIVFNSSIIHSVSEVISGERHSLCGWIDGPPFA
jgi:hypothetical protein